MTFKTVLNNYVARIGILKGLPSDILGNIQY